MSRETVSGRVLDGGLVPFDRILLRLLEFAGNAQVSIWLCLAWWQHPAFSRSTKMPSDWLKQWTGGLGPVIPYCSLSLCRKIRSIYWVLASSTHAYHRHSYI